MERKRTALVCELQRFVRSPVAFLCLFATASLFLGGCGAMGNERAGKPASEEETTGAGVPDTARVVCGPEGTRVLTPRVEARPDGVHFVIDNRFEAEVGYSFEEPEGGGGGDSAPKGESSHVWNLPPGEVRVGCEKPPVDGIGTDYATLKVVKGDSGYKLAGLECKGGMAYGGGAQYAPGAGGMKGDLVERTRRQFSEEIQNGDVVELAGYPELRDGRVVRIVRDGRVIATVHFLGEPGDWLQDRYEACMEF